MKGEKVVCAKIPDHYDSRRNEFGGVKFYTLLLIEQVNNGIVHAQSN
jgi:hypothetical protein